MDRSNGNKDNVSVRSGGGRPLHTYTPRSHEDLLRSHLKLDAAKQGKLENELQRLASENDRLRWELDKARQDLQAKDDQINILNNELRDKGRTPPSFDRPQQDTRPVYEVDGKPVSLEELLTHFNAVIQRHHDLINRKNDQIQDLQDALDNLQKQKDRQPLQSTRPQDNEAFQQNLMNEFTNQLTLIRKEYEQVEIILTDRNNKLEKLIEDLQIKLDEYAGEIQNLRNELTTRETPHGPSESTTQLVKEKEKEIVYLKEIIASFKDQRQVNQDLPNQNEELENEIKKIIANKKDAINKLNTMINTIKKETPDLTDDAYGKPSLSDVEKDCQNMLDDLNNMNDRLNSILKKLKASTQTTLGETIEDKSDIIINLENLKIQCQEEISILKKQIGQTGGRSKEGSVILRGQAVVKIDDPNYGKNKPVSGEQSQMPPNESDNSPSNIQFVLYPSTPQQRTWRPQEAPQYGQVSPQPSSQYTPEHRQHKLFPCEACSDAHLSTEKIVSFVPKQEHPSKTSSKKKMIDEFYGPSGRAVSRERAKKQKSKGGCCGKKESETSNVPYSKRPDEEQVVSVHSPNQDNPQNLYPVLRKNDYSYETNSPSTPAKKKTYKMTQLK